MYSKLPNLVLGFHGCDKSIFEKVLVNHEKMTKSENKYDWLGNGIYFWENSFQRALEWATSNSSRKGSQIKTPAVIGAVIDLGYCLNLTDFHCKEVLQKGYEILKIKCRLSCTEMPVNKNLSDSTDLILRDLDCAVIQQIHEYHKESKLRMYDSVRGVFIEGAEVYPGSGFKEKTHIQLCVINPNCIKGYFNPLSSDNEYAIP